MILKNIIYDYQHNIYTTGRAFCRAKKLYYNRYYHLITKGITPYQISIWLDNPNDERIANIRWMFENSPNKNNCNNFELPLVYNGELYASYADLCRQLGVNYETFCKRKERRCTFEECLYGRTKKVKEPKINKQEVTFDGKSFKTLKELCQYYNFNDSAVRSRLHRGFPLDEVVKYYLVKQSKDRG